MYYFYTKNQMGEWTEQSGALLLEIQLKSIKMKKQKLINNREEKLSFYIFYNRMSKVI